MQLGFVIDHSRCIGCHACTVACKAENDVPLGKFRTWVKYTETGIFPQVRRSFAVLRCNQCSQPPCVDICPVTALEKRSDGIVDVDPALCVGCKACMQACPYDALYLDEESGTAEKCHFCAHRVERGLAPACAVVCPTEAIIPGDFHDPESQVARLRDAGGLDRRNLAAGTDPNVYYREADPAGLDPLATRADGAYLWAERRPGVDLAGARFDAARMPGMSRTVYNVDHEPLWGWKVSAYLFTKSVAAGAFLAGGWFLSSLAPAEGAPPSWRVGIPLLGLLGILVTTALLVADLRRPERFLSILLRPNHKSWLVRGSYCLIGYSVLLTVWLGLGLFGVVPDGVAALLLTGVTALAAALAAAYTAWLFAQAKGRVLWGRRGMAFDLVVQAVVGGAAVLLLAGWCFDLASGSLGFLRLVLGGALLVRVAFVLGEARLAPAGREAEYARIALWIEHGPFARRRWGLGLMAGLLLPLGTLGLGLDPAVWAVGAVLALIGLYNEEDLLVRAGQALPIS